MATSSKSVSFDQDLLDDAELNDALAQLDLEAGSDEVMQLLKMMNEQRIITWDEAERIMQDAGGTQRPVKSSLLPQTRPSEPENATDPDNCIQLLQQNDKGLTEINLNNMKRTPVPQLQRLIMAAANNTNLKKLSLANLGLGDKAAEPLIEMIERNKSLQALNLETNYLSGEFIARLFEAACNNQTLGEIKCVNQSVLFSTSAERRIIEAVQRNHGMTKVSISLRMPEGRHKLEKAMMANGEIRRVKRREEAKEAEKKKLADLMPKPARRPGNRNYDGM